MAEIAASMVMDLRQRTGLGMMECKKALTEAGGDLGKAEELLRIKSGAKASKAAGRVAAEGVIGLFVAPDKKTAAMVEVNCETDFVAKNEGFRVFVKDITLHIAAAQPLYVSRDQVPAATVEAERAIYAAQVKGKPENVATKIVEGKLDKFYSTVCLLEQGFIKNPDQMIKELVASKIAEIGENIVIRRFTRYSVGEPLTNEPVRPPGTSE